MNYHINVIVTLLLVISRDRAFAQKMNIAVLYESLCPDSLKFVNNQLYPNWEQISPYVNLHLVPFGKSKSVNGGPRFQCQHGPMECVGNKIQSCALHSIHDATAQVQFVRCFMNAFAQNDAGQTCAAQIGLDWAVVEQCYNSQTGTSLQLQAERLTQSIAPAFVPTVVYNEVFSQEDQDESQTDFGAVVCRNLNKTHPGICSRP